MMSFPIKRSWIFSRTAGKIYFLASIAGFGFFIFLFAIAFSENWMGPLPSGYWVELVLRSVTVLGAIALGTLWVAMWFCVIRYDMESIAGSIYLAVFILFGPLGSLIYYTARYRRLLDRELDPPKVAVASV
jgi:hypothetical protein